MGNNMALVIVFRVDSSSIIGIGHLMRCLTLADELQRSGAVIHFICRDLPGNAIFLVEKKYKIHLLPATSVKLILNNYETWLGATWQQDALDTQRVLVELAIKPDLLVIDHYGIDSRWENIVYESVKKILVVDDLANRCHLCDFLLDQDMYDDPQKRYISLVPTKCKMLLGPEYCLIRQEFAIQRKSLKAFREKVERICIFFGGGDLTNETSKALKALESLRNNISVDVIVGTSNPHREKIASLCHRLPNCTYYYQISNMAEVLSEADIAIGAAGTTVWERFCLGVPSIVHPIADNQIEGAYYLSSHNLVVGILKNKVTSSEDYRIAVNLLIGNTELRKQIHFRTLKLVDALGTKRVADFLLAKIVNTGDNTGGPIYA